MIQIKSDLVKNEDGMGLVEVVASIVLLGILLPGVAYLFVFSQQVIQSNKMRSEAIQVLEDIKQNFEYRGQTQDWSDLNRVSIVKHHEETLEDELLQLRRDHLILDNTGIEFSKKDTVYREIPINEEDGSRGTFIRKVDYTKSDGLPEILDNLENQKYMGNYLKWNAKDKKYETTDFLVRVDVLERDERIEEALDLDIGVWDQHTGAKLHSTVYKWVIKF